MPCPHSFAREVPMSEHTDPWTAPLSAEAIRAMLPDLAVRCYDRIDSTNSEARRLVNAGLREPILLTAEEQTGGRGRQGKSFYSPRGTGLYLTLVIHPQAPPEDVIFTTTAAAVAVCRAIRRTTDATPEIKWVNDLYLGDKKCCGILAEALTDPGSGAVRSLIIGVGVNLWTRDFPDGLARTATSLHPALGGRAQLAAAIARELLTVTADPADRSWMADYRRWSMILGRDVWYWRGEECRPARALAIEEDGGLLVEHPDGSRVLLQSGEISLRLCPDQERTN